MECGNSNGYVNCRGGSGDDGRYYLPFVTEKVRGSEESPRPSPRVSPSSCVSPYVESSPRGDISPRSEPSSSGKPSVSRGSSVAPVDSGQGCSYASVVSGKVFRPVRSFSEDSDLRVCHRVLHIFYLIIFHPDNPILILTLVDVLILFLFSIWESCLLLVSNILGILGGCYTRNTTQHIQASFQ